MLVRIRNQYMQKGFTLIEVVMALGVAFISVIGAYSLTLAIEKHYRSSAAILNVYRQSTIAMERLFRDISETSNKTITIKTTSFRSAEGVRDDAISFASARDTNRNFQWESYGALDFCRPAWQKAIIYYLFDDPKDSDVNNKKLYRKEVPETNWSSKYTSGQLNSLINDANGEVIARNVDYLYFGPPYPQVDPDITVQDHILDVSLKFLVTRSEVKAGAIPEVKLSTGIPIMNRERR